MNAQNLTPEETARMDAETMKLKLIAEHGAIIHVADNIPLPSEMELAWYNHIANYEQVCKAAGYATVYEVIGQPEYKRAEELKPEEFETASDHLLEIMYENGVALHFDDKEDPATIYRFVTEELFEETICKYRGPEGDGHTVFNYYDFHPDHYEDVKAASEEFLDHLFRRPKWDGEFLHYTHGSDVTVNGRKMDLEGYSKCMERFKTEFLSSQLFTWTIESIDIQLEQGCAVTKGFVTSGSLDKYAFQIIFGLDHLWVIHEMGLDMIRMGA